jgi:nucleolar complex protein 3
VQREKQVKENIFKKSKTEQKQAISNGKSKKKEKGKSINHLEEERNKIVKLSDIQDMLSSDDEDNGNESNGYHSASKRQKLSEGESDSEIEFENDGEDDEEEEVDDSEDEEITEQMEIQQKQNFKDESTYKGKIKELLPIKTKSGVLPRATTHDEEESKPSPAIQDDFESDTDEEEEHAKAVKVANDRPKKKVLSASELLSEREEEFKIKKFRIGKMCSNITERPEEKVGSLRVLVDFMQMYGSNKLKNLLSIRKLAMLSLVEVFKDIVPEYKIGVIDLENQKVKKDTLARITYENELLKYYKKYLKESEILLKALKPGKFSKRPSKEAIYLGESAVECLCELLKTHPYFNFSTNIAQLLVIYLNCANSSARKTINETFVKIFKTDKRHDITLHVSKNVTQSKLLHQPSIPSTDCSSHKSPREEKVQCSVCGGRFVPVVTPNQKH